MLSGMLDGTCPTPEARTFVLKRGVAVTGSNGHLDLLVARAQYCAPYEHAQPRVIRRIETTLQAGTTLSQQPRWSQFRAPCSQLRLQAFGVRRWCPDRHWPEAPEPADGRRYRRSPSCLSPGG